MANIQNMNLIIIITTTFNQFLQALCHLIFIITLQVSNYNYSIFFLFYFIFKLYIIVLVLPNIKMNPPQVIPF